VLHLSAVAIHLIWKRDGVLGRMLPANAAEPAAQGASPVRQREPGFVSASASMRSKMS